MWGLGLRAKGLGFRVKGFKGLGQDFRRANLLNTRASRYEQSATRLPLHFPSTVKTLTACTPFQRVDVSVVACRRHIRGDGRARNVRTRAYPFRRASWVLRKIVFLPVNALHAPTLKQTIRAYNWWEAGAPRARARSRTRFARVICGKFSPRAFIGRELFWNFVKRYTGN